MVLSILPATFREMRADVHIPEKYGIFQSVGDTAGPGGVLRAMRTVLIYEDYARKIKAVCPDAWVINFTNPMSACVKTLYGVFPEIKAFGCCHEVFHAQQILCSVLKETRGIAERNLNKIFAAFINQPLCGALDFAQAEALFKEMCFATRGYLEPYFDLDGYFKN